MTQIARKTALTLTAAMLVGLLPVPGIAAEPDSMTAKEYKLWVDYQNALEDPRVKKMSAKRRLGAIARNFKVTVKELNSAIAKGDRHAEGLVEANQAAAKAALEATPVGPAIASVELVDHTGTVVAYVSWGSTEKERLTTEAVYIAQAVADAAPVTDTIALWSCMGKTKVWTAKVRASAASRISKSRIEDFAQTRYLRLFEDVRNTFEGTPPVRPKTDPETGEPVKDPRTGEPVMEPDTQC